MPRLPLLLLLFGLLLTPCAAADKYALLIGIKKYQRAQLNEAEIKYPEADAAAVGKVLEASGYTVVTLLGQQATRTAIEEALAELRNHGSAGGIVLIGLYGHGVRYSEGDFFCPWDTTIRRLKDIDGGVFRNRYGEELAEPDPVSLISIKQLLDALHACGADNRVIIADCCRKDPAASRSAALVPQKAFGARLRTADLKEGTAALFSCSAAEHAFEHADWGHGAFTQAFLNYHDGITADRRSLVSDMIGSLNHSVNTLVQSKDPRARQTVNAIVNGVVDLQLTPGNRSR